MMKSFKVLVISFLSIIIIGLIGCSNSLEYSNDSSLVASDDMAIEYGGKARLEFEVEPSLPRESLNVITSSERMVIYNANLSLEVKDYHKVEASIQEKVSNLGGFIIESSVYFSGENHINGNLVVKVPQKSFNLFLTEVEDMSVNVLDRRVQGTDVTEEYVDLESRLKSKRVVEERLLTFMKDAKKTEDLLRISSDLANVQEDIERLLGRMNYLQTNVEYATLTIYMSEKLINVVSIQNTEALNTWVKAKSLFVDSVNSMITFFSTVLIFLIGRSPIILPVAVIAFLLVFFFKKKRQED